MSKPAAIPFPRLAASRLLALALGWTLPLCAQVMQPRSRPASAQAKPSAIIPAAPATPAASDESPASLLQQPPSQAVIQSTLGKLTIQASNASLTQTLQRISEKTGMKVDGVSGDERVFGTFGPGAPRDVIRTLLDGTSYNMIMVGSLAGGAPRELLLSQRTTGTTPAATPQQPQNQDAGQDEDSSADQQQDDPPPVTPPPGRPMNPGPGGQMQPRSPQDLLQQLRQQQQQQNQPQ